MKNKIAVWFVAIIGVVIISAQTYKYVTDYLHDEIISVSWADGAIFLVAILLLLRVQKLIDIVVAVVKKKTNT